MDNYKLSSKYYKPGIKKEPCASSRVMKVSIIVLILSWAIAFFLASLLEFGFNGSILMASFIFVLIFALSLSFSSLMIFISKQHNEIIWLRIICYLILIGTVILVCVGVGSILDTVLDMIIKSNGVIDEEQLTEAIKNTNGFFTTAIIFDILFNFAMLVSFKIKKLEDNVLAKVGLVIYVLMAIANIFAYSFEFIMPSSITLLTSVLWVLCLYFVLEDRTVKVQCVILVDENGNEIEDEEQRQKDKENKRLKRIKLIDNLKKTALVFLGVVGAICSAYVFKNKYGWTQYGVASAIIVFFSILAYRFIGEIEYNWLDILSCALGALGLILSLIIAVIYPNFEWVAVTVLSFLILGSLSFSSFVYLFRNKYSNDKSLKLRKTAFVVYAIVALYYLMCIFFSDDIVLQSTHVLPVLFWVYVVCTATVYFWKGE